MKRSTKHEGFIKPFFFSIIKLRDSKHPVIVRVLKWISLLQSLVKSARMESS